MTFPRMRKIPFGRESSEFIFGYAELFKTSRCYSLGFGIDPLFPVVLG